MILHRTETILAGLLFTINWVDTLINIIVVSEIGGGYFQWVYTFFIIILALNFQIT